MSNCMPQVTDFFLNNSDFEGFLNPAAFNLLKTAFNLKRCSSGVWLNTIISSRYIMYQVRCNSPTQDSLNLWKVSGALASPNGILSHSQNPSGPVVNAVRGFASSPYSTCQYPDFRSKVENQMAPCRKSNVSIFWVMHTHP